MPDWRFIFSKWVLGKNWWRNAPYEPEVAMTLKQFSGNTFVDVGANKGRYTCLLAKQFTHVHAFEPNPETQPLLLENLAKLKMDVRNRIVVHFEALSDKNGTADLFLSDINPKKHTGSADTLLPVFEYKPSPAQMEPIGRKGQTYIGKRTVSVPVRTFDSYLDDFGIVDLVKIDVEGAEFLVLQGMRKSMAEGLIKHILVELHNADRKQELTQILSKHFSRLTWVDPDHILANETK